MRSQPASSTALVHYSKIYYSFEKYINNDTKKGNVFQGGIF